MTLRRYAPIAKSSGTRIPPQVRLSVLERDEGCVMRQLDPEHVCAGRLELDHVRASGGLGMKSPSTEANLVSLCSEAHRTKTEAGRTWRPLLLRYLATVEGQT